MSAEKADNRNYKPDNNAVGNTKAKEITNSPFNKDSQTITGAQIGSIDKNPINNSTSACNNGMEEENKTLITSVDIESNKKRLKTLNTNIHEKNEEIEKHAVIMDDTNIKSSKISDASQTESIIPDSSLKARRKNSYSTAMTDSKSYCQSNEASEQREKGVREKKRAEKTFESKNKLKMNTIEHLNFVLKSERLPLKVRLIAKYLFHLQIPNSKDAILAIFLACKMMENRLHGSFLQKYDNHPMEFSQRELAFLLQTDFMVDYSIDFIDLYSSLFKILEQEIPYRFNRNFDVEYGANIRTMWRNDIIKVDDKIVKNVPILDRFNFSILNAVSEPSYTLNLYNYAHGKTRAPPKIPIPQRTKELLNDTLNKMFNKSTGYDYGDGFMGFSEEKFMGFSGETLNEEQKEATVDAGQLFSRLIAIIEDMHDCDEIIGRFYCDSDFPFYLFFMFIGNKLLGKLKIALDLGICESKLRLYKAKYGKYVL